MTPLAPGAFATAEAECWSPVLDEPVRYRVHRTPGPDADRCTLYLLHGRGGSWEDWPAVLPALDVAAVEGLIAPLLVVMPDAPWSGRASFYVDSRFTGVPCGRPVESALVDDLVPHVDRSEAGVADREHRYVAGGSMGGAGALRLLLGHPDLFAGGAALAPAAYETVPDGSSARTGGAFGSGARRFASDVYAAAAYSAQLAAFDARLPVRLWVAVGDDDELAGAAAALYQRARGVLGVQSRLHLRPGGHDQATWRAALIAGLPFVTGERP